jgi:hypothetical protein
MQSKANQEEDSNDNDDNITRNSATFASHETMTATLHPPCQQEHDDKSTCSCTSGIEVQANGEISMVEQQQQQLQQELDWRESSTIYSCWCRSSCSNSNNILAMYYFILAIMLLLSTSTRFLATISHFTMSNAGQWYTHTRCTICFVISCYDK